MSAEDAARRWAETWERGWRDHDVGAIAALYAGGAVFRSEPFREPHEPRAYAEWAFADEKPGADVLFGAPLVAGKRAVVEYWAVTRSGSGEETIAGVSLLRFDDDGLVVEQRDYWSSKPGRHVPHEHFGR